MSVQSQTVEKTIFCFIDSDGDEGYVSYVYDSASRDPTFNTTYNLNDAGDMSNHSYAEMTRLFYHYQREIDYATCHIKKIKTIMEVEEIGIDDDEMREIRQRIAIGKLNETDIKALGITNIATYIKTKFHNT